jgi:hypothetical protein
MSRLSVMCLVLFSFSCLSALYGYASDVPADDIYNVGVARIYEVTQPKTGFVGSPMEHVQRAFWSPTLAEHFDKQYVRVEVVEKRTDDRGRTVVLRGDQVEKDGDITKKGVYWIFVDISSTGTRVVGSYSDKRDDERATDTRHSFSLSRPPVLGFKDGKVDGYVVFQGHGVMYSRKDGDTSSALIVEATRFENARAFEKDTDRAVHWYVADIADLAKADSGATILYREKQQWDKADDWLWRKMERFDAKGNVLMRCVLIEQTDAAPGEMKAKEGAKGNK